MIRRPPRSTPLYSWQRQMCIRDRVRERVRGYWIRSDCWYEGYGLRVELDGELAHPGRATHRDVLRDNDVLLMTGDLTLRYRWWHTLAGACVSAVSYTHLRAHETKANLVCRL